MKAKFIPYTKHLLKGEELLIESITTKMSNWSAENNLWAADSKDSRKKIKKQIVDAALNWYQNNYASQNDEIDRYLFSYFQ